jgi:transposase, IS5 family
MFKIIVLQSLYKLSNDQMELQIKGRLLFMHFLNHNFEDTEPVAKTLWFFRDTLSNKNTINKLFRRFGWYHDQEGLFPPKGQLINASIFPVPEQRNTCEENTRIKHGEVPEEWQEQP